MKFYILNSSCKVFLIVFKSSWNTVRISKSSWSSLILHTIGLAIIEAGKRVATFPTPLSGIVVDVNEEVIKNPELINKKPYSSWIAKLKATNLEEVKNLQSAKEIVKTVKDFIILEDVDCSIVEE